MLTDDEVADKMALRPITLKADVSRRSNIRLHHAEWRANSGTERKECRLGVNGAADVVAFRDADAVFARERAAELNHQVEHARQAGQARFSPAAGSWVS